MLKRTLEELRTEALEELRTNDDLFVEMINELDSWNGYADGFRAYPMYELNDLFCDYKVSDFLDKLAPGFNHTDAFMVDTIYGLDSTDDIVDLYRAHVTEAELLENIIDYQNHLYFSDSDFADLIDEIANYEWYAEEEEKEAGPLDGFTAAIEEVGRNIDGITTRKADTVTA